MNKQKTLEKLHEESSAVYSCLLLIRNLYLLSISLILLAMLSGVLFSAKFAVVLQRDQTSLVSLMIGSLALGSPLKSDGSFNIVRYLAGCTGSILNVSLSAFIFHTILQVFKNIKNGQTPFTPKNASYWRKCYKIYAVLMVISFLGAFILGPLGLTSFLSFLLAACFFLSLSLVFEYGSWLQQESDETL